MNTFRDPATNVSIHIPTEADDATWARSERPARGLASGNATKYSPIAQQRAREEGFAMPEGVEEYTARVVGYGQIHPRA